MIKLTVSRKHLIPPIDNVDQSSDDPLFPKVDFALYREMFSSENKALLLFDSRGKLCDVTVKIEEIFGYDRQEIIGKSALSLARLLTRKGPLLWFRNPLKNDSKDKRSHEVDSYAKHGKRVTLKLIPRILEHHGKVIGRLVEVVVLDQYRYAEEALITKDVYRSLVNHVGIGVFRATPGSSGRFLEVNPAVEVITGYERQELLQMKVSDLYVNSEERNIDSLQVLSGESTSPKESRFKKKDGTTILVRIKEVPVTSPDEYAVYLEGFLEDITEQKEAERDLKASEEFQRSVVENAPIGMAISDSRGFFTGANEVFLRTLGYTESELRELTFKEITHPEDLSMSITKLKDLHQGKISHFIQEKRYLKKDGQVINGRVSVSLVRLKGGNSFHHVVQLQDITEHVAALESRRESENKYRALLEQLPQIVCEADIEGKVVFANENAIRAFGYSPNDLKLGLVLWNMIDENDRQKAQQNAQKVFKGESLSGMEYLAKHKDGTTFPILVYSNQVIRDGVAAGLRIIAVDITYRKSIEKELLFSDVAFKSIHEGIFATDGCDVLTHWNSICEIIFDIKASEAIGKNVVEVIRVAEDYATQSEERTRLLKEKGYCQGEMVYVTRRGQVCVDIRSTAMELNGKIVGWVSLVLDITDRKKAQDIMKASEERYRTLVAASPNGIIQADIDGIIAFASPQILRLIGCSSMGEVVGGSLLQWIIPEDRETARQNLIRVSKGETLNPNSYRVIRKDGRTFWTEVHSSALRDDEGRPKGIISVISDITARKQAEEEIIRREKRARTLLIATNDMAHLIDEEGMIIDVNDAMAAALRESKDKLIGTCVYDRYPGEKAEIRKQLVKGVIAEQKQLRFLDEQNDKVYESSISPIVTAKGERQQVVVFARDVTARLLAESQVRKAAEEWRTTFDAMTDSIAIIDSNCKLIRVNNAFARTVGKSPKELIGMTCFETIHLSNCSIEKCPHQETLRTKKPAMIELIEHNTNRSFEVSTSPIFNEKGEVTASVHVARDTTERRKMQDQLMLTDRLASIGELVSGVAHEINNPLTGILGFSQLLSERNLPADMMEEVHIIQSEAQRTANIVKDLLTFARKHQPVKQPNQINQIIDDVLKLRNYEHRVNNIEVVKRYDPNLPPILVDYFQMQQVFLNLIINAEYFMLLVHGEGTLAIKTERVAGMVRISFEDDGPGIRQDDLEKVFDPFFTTKEVGKGTGLGLSICHGIVGEHNGRVYACSEIGKGATFIIELPIEVIEKSPDGPIGSFEGN
jgi:PAS domain S-box-containing protein